MSFLTFGIRANPQLTLDKFWLKSFKSEYPGAEESAATQQFPIGQYLDGN